MMVLGGAMVAFGVSEGDKFTDRLSDPRLGTVVGNLAS
jgi:hypothetical protein